MNELVARALSGADDTRFLRMGRGVLAECRDAFLESFGDAKAVVVADRNTWQAAGNTVNKVLGSLAATEPIVFYESDFHAEYQHVDRLRDELLARGDVIPVAVGSGTLNDLTKLAAHQVGRRYMIVATAASMDGYTAYGASITRNGSKQTFTCPAPLAVVADLDVIGRAPAGMNSSGYADMIAKITAGADWILADVLGVEPIHTDSWMIVQSSLRDWLSRAPGVGRGEPDAVGGLMEGLLLGGFAMQSAKSSRPASGADHQFSHLWDMLNHTHNGTAPSHGHKVGIGAQASCALYEALFELSLENLDVDVCLAAWHTMEEQEHTIRALYDVPELADKAVEETRAKFVPRSDLKKQLTLLQQRWPELHVRLRKQLLPLRDMQAMLRAAGAPVEPEEIGVSREMLRQSYHQAYHIRRRFTVLDVAVRTLTLCPAL